MDPKFLKYFKVTLNFLIMQVTVLPFLVLLIQLKAFVVSSQHSQHRSLLYTAELRSTKKLPRETEKNNSTVRYSTMAIDFDELDDLDDIEWAELHYEWSGRTPGHIPWLSTPT